MSKPSAKELVRQLYWEFHDELEEAYHVPHQTLRTSIPQVAAMLTLATTKLDPETYAALADVFERGGIETDAESVGM
jgi:hypothetical protein